MRYFLTLLFVFSIFGGLTACGSSAPVLKPFKMDIQQGNVVTSKMLLQLKPGMTKSQVRFIMGTPLIVDSFHKDRWDYFYQMRQAGKVIEQRRVILTFEKDLLKNVRGDVVPQGSPEAASGDVSTSKTIVMPEKKTVEKSWTEKLKFWKKDEAPAAKPIEAPKEVAPTPEVASPEVPAEVPSVLAVPIEIKPPAEAAPTEMPKAEPAAVEAATNPAKVEATAEPVEPPKAVLAPVEVQKPAAPAPNKAVQPVNKDEKMIFRLDRTLKQELLEQEAAPKVEAPATEKPVEAPVKPKKKAVEAPLPPETEPTFFDKMLEKIGF